MITENFHPPGDNIPLFFLLSSYYNMIVKGRLDPLVYFFWKKRNKINIVLERKRMSAFVSLVHNAKVFLVRIRSFLRLG